MKSLELGTLLDLFSGVDHWRETAAGMIPRRLPEAAIDFCQTLDPIKGLRARGGAGVRMNASSTTRHLSFRADIISRGDESCYPDCIFALKDDCGHLEYHCLSDSENSGTLTWELPEGNRSFTLYFPWQGETLLSNFQIDEEAELHALPRKPMLQLIGDSITEGMLGWEPETSYANRLGDLLHVEILNSGVGGLQMEPDFVRMVHEKKAAGVLLAFGVNDASLQKSPELFEHDVCMALHYITQIPNQKHYLLLPLVWPGEDHSAAYPLTLYRTIMRRAAAKFPGVYVIEGETLLDNKPEYFEDGVHPNSLGMAKLAAALAKAISAGLSTHIVNEASKNR